MSIAADAGTVSLDDPARRFTSTTRLFGAAAMARLQQGQAVVVGIGGVGSWAAEALGRSGVGRLHLVDLDQVAESNINRQVHALDATVGAAKVEVMAARLRQIAPQAHIETVEAFAEAGKIAAVMPASITDGRTVVVDAIDDVAAKAALLAWCVERRVPVTTCGAAGGRADPLALTAADLTEAHGDALLAAVRNRLRRDYGFPSGQAQRGRKPAGFGIVAIFSPESMAGSRPDDPGITGLIGGAPLACAGYGSVVTVTAAMGFAAASRALARLSSGPDHD